jgi:phosphate transport system substrate-binding protein
MTQPASEHILGQDGVAVIVNRQNPVRMLTFDQLSRIFTGAVTDWSAVGGTAGPIKVVARDTASGTYDTFSSLVAKGAPLKAAQSFDNSAALSGAVSADPSAIGFIGLPYVKEAKAVAVREGEALPLVPTVFSVATEDYPLTRRLYLYSDDDPKNPLAASFIGFAQSEDGQKLVEASGFVSLAVRAEVPPPMPGAPDRYTKDLAGASRLSVDFRFRTGAVQIDNKGLRDLDRVVSYLAQNKNKQVLLAGFADKQGDEGVNEGLSRQRAEAVSKVLKQRGVVPTTVDGFGSAMPIAPNATPEGRERNRRVEVWIR